MILKIIFVSISFYILFRLILFLFKKVLYLYFYKQIYSPIKKYIIPNKNSLKIGIISDFQISEKTDKIFITNTKKALNYFKNQKVDILILPGDLADDESSFKKVKQIIDEYFPLDSEVDPIKILLMGNHEFCGYYRFDLCNFYIINMIRFIKIFKRCINSHIIINGYHFITLSNDSYRIRPELIINTKWLEDQIQIALNDSCRENDNNQKEKQINKPIFVITHMGPYGTSCGTENYCNKSLRKLLNKYPQVISISGHSHFSLKDERSIWQGEFTNINTQSVSFIELEGGRENGPIPTDEYGNNGVASSNPMGLLMDLFYNKMEIKRICFNNDEIYNKPWVLNFPLNKDNFPYKFDKRKKEFSAPFFDVEFNIQPIVIVKDNQNFFQIKFKQANYKNYIHTYKILFRKNQFKKECLYFSDFYKLNNEIKEYITLRCPKEIGFGKYNIQITAIDFFGNKSPPVNDLVEFIRVKKKND